jgi:hypothetical protein
MTKPVYWSPLSFAQSLRVINWVRQWDIDKLKNVNKTLLVFVSHTIQCCKLLARFAAHMFMKIRPMESNLLNSASDFLYHTHFYFSILSLAAKISARWVHCHKHGTCYSIVSCSPLFLIGAHFSSLAISQLYDLSLFKKMTKKRPCSEINAFKNSDPGKYLVDRKM